MSARTYFGEGNVVMPRDELAQPPSTTRNVDCSELDSAAAVELWG